MAQLVSAVASLLWPLLVLVALLVFRAPLSRIIRSAEAREWTLEVGGQKITVKQLSEQQNALITDLQEQLGALRRTVAELSAHPATPRGGSAPVASSAADPASSGAIARGGRSIAIGGGAASAAPSGSAPRSPQPTAPPQPAPPQPAPPQPQAPAQPHTPTPPQAPTQPLEAAKPGSEAGPGATATSHRPQAYAVLWVDDNPQNNALLIEQLQRHGLLVDLAINTQTGLRLLGRRRYGMVISDMVRFEQGTEILDAGLRLLTAVRQTDRDIPFVIYCNPRARDINNDAALAGGATAITSSGATVLELLRLAELL
ncbi:MAG: response regulator [Micromonosporaceae bacterium]|nr:response regulator [Micromonosporaceae bacterium]